MNQIEKFLRLLSAKEREVVLLILFQVQKDFSQIPGIKKLGGHKNLYRVRVGRFRIIFQIEKEVKVVRITKRDEQSYENL